MEDFCAEATANVRCNNTQFVLWDTQNKRAHQKTDNVRVLRGGVERRFIVRLVIVTNSNTRLHRVRDQTVVDQLKRGDVSRFFKRFVNCCLVFFNKTPVVAEVRSQFVVNFWRIGSERRHHVHNSRKLFDVEANCFGSVARLLLGFSDNRCNRIAHVTDLTTCQNGVTRFLHRLAMTVSDLPTARKTADAFEIRTCEDTNNAWHVFSVRSVDRFDDAVCNIGPQEMHVCLAMQVYVVCVLTFTGQKSYVFAPLWAGADTMIFRHLFLPRLLSTPLIQQRLRLRPARWPP